MSQPDETADRLDLADLVHAYARAVRERRTLDCAALFTDDGVFEIRERNPADPASNQLRAALEGREAIGAYVSTSTGGSVRVCPLIHNLMVSLAGDEAEGNCVMETRSWPPGSELIGEYHDSFRRTAEGWRFSRRVYTILRAPG
jgi:hypothetical protein